MKNRSEIVLRNVQIKSLEKARMICRAINILEEESFIRSGKVTFENPFICPWINLDKLNETEMEKLIAEILKKIRKKQE